jgi:hypothetical protein
MTLLHNLIEKMVEQSSTCNGAGIDIPEDAMKNRTSRLIYQIEQRPGITTAELARDSGLPSSLVWGLLKHARATGRIDHGVQDGWRMSTARDDKKIAEAAALLKSRGWTCEPPRQGKAE